MKKIIISILWLTAVLIAAISSSDEREKTYSATSIDQR
jgi:ABC-type Fe3+-citrate transport system substrate-binding protein